MPASDDEELRDASDDDAVISGRRKATGARSRGPEANFEVTTAWDQFLEGADGSITNAVEGLLEAGKRRRYITRCLEGSSH